VAPNSSAVTAVDVIGDTTMAKGQSMTVADVVAQVRDGRFEDFVREAVALVAREILDAEITQSKSGPRDALVAKLQITDSVGGVRRPSKVPNVRRECDTDRLGSEAA
jgi:hypothetical protein